ncbi:histidine kinase [bacterium]|nr:histidine kinase [bacterium]
MSQIIAPVGADTQEEVRFGLDEMFYSRTDARGVILAGNEVFRRVSGHDWNKLIGAPHRLVRHRATPRAVFRILWTTIQAGEPAVAYVCNRAADGRPYWVLATVLPYAQGYLSVRIKPTSPLFVAARDLYKRLAAAEANEGFSIEASVRDLEASLRDLGFADYPGFMRAALSQEYAAREVALHRAERFPHEAVRLIRQGLFDTLAGQDALQNNFERLKILPRNLSILASRLEPSGGPLVAVAKIYLEASLAILKQINAFTAGKASLCGRMSDLFERAAFLTICSNLQQEIGHSVVDEDWSRAGLVQEVEVGQLDRLGAHYRQSAQTAIDEACALAERMLAAGVDLRRAMLSLETVTVMGKVESARLGPEGDRVRDTMLLLHELNVEISKALDRISVLSATLHGGMHGIKSSFAT